MDYIGPIHGSSLIPPFFLSIFFLIVVFINTFLIIFIKKKYFNLNYLIKISILFKSNIFAFSGLLMVLALIALHILLPQPQAIISFTENIQNNPSGPIIIEFTKPVMRKNIIKSIFPEIPGRWVFASPIYSTHLYTKLYFFPQNTLKSDTVYTIKLEGVKNFLQTGDGMDYNLTYKTSDSAKISKINFVNNLNTKNDISELEVYFDKPIEPTENFYFSFFPDINYEKIYNTANNSYSLILKQPLTENIPYLFKAYKENLTLDTQTTEVVARSNAQLVYKSYLNSDVLGLTSFSPDTDIALLRIPIVITFADPMEKTSVENNFSISPFTDGKIEWKDDFIMVFTPLKYLPDTKYTVFISKEALLQNGKKLNEDINQSFTTIGKVRILDTFPKNGWTEVSVDNNIKISFNQPVDKQSAENHFSISPLVSGKFTWEDYTLIFNPDDYLSYETEYQIKISKNIPSLIGLDSDEDYNFNFTTQNSTTNLKVPQLLQKYALSCEIAALRMVLAYRGVSVDEDFLLSKIGTDNTPKTNNTWGNPYMAFVGNVRGRQMHTGYGVYWEPIANVANLFRYAKSFQNWSLTQITESLEKGHPVIVWVNVQKGSPTNWYTTGGDNIYAVTDEHAVVVTGFVGTAKNPSYLIINDPLSGQVYWDRNLFEKKWSMFHQSGVIVY